MSFLVALSVCLGPLYVSIQEKCDKSYWGECWIRSRKYCHFSGLFQPLCLTISNSRVGYQQDVPLSHSWCASGVAVCVRRNVEVNPVAMQLRADC